MEAYRMPAEEARRLIQDCLSNPGRYDTWKIEILFDCAERLGMPGEASDLVGLVADRLGRPDPEPFYVWE